MGELDETRGQQYRYHSDSYGAFSVVLALNALNKLAIIDDPIIA